MSAGRRGRRPLRGAAQVCPVGRRIDCPFGYHRSLRVQFTSAGRRGRRPLRGAAQGSPCRAADRLSLRVSSIPTGAVHIGGPSGTPAPTGYSAGFALSGDGSIVPSGIIDPYGCSSHRRAVGDAGPYVVLLLPIACSRLPANTFHCQLSMSFSGQARLVPTPFHFPLSTFHFQLSPVNYPLSTAFSGQARLVPTLISPPCSELLSPRS